MVARLLLLIPCTAFAAPALAQAPAQHRADTPVCGTPVSPPDPEVLQAATLADHRDMLAQLGIERLRPGPSGDESAPNHANYDEALANPYPVLPDALTLDDGGKVTTANEWWHARRPEIVEAFEREVFGRVPPDAPDVDWIVTGTREWNVGGRQVVGRQLVGRVDNSAWPAITVEICMTLVMPAERAGPVPVMILFGSGVLPPPGDAAATGPAELIAAGWGYASLDPRSIQADNGAGLARGIIGLTNKGERRKPDDWGALRAWAWGASKARDWLDAQPGVDPRRVGIEGVSRYGKAALVAMAFDPRFDIAFVASSGEGGAKLHRRRWGEQVENLTGSGEYHWMAGNFLKYGAAEAAFGSMDAGDLPVDAHELLALCAPRPVFVSYGVPEAGDAKWLDQQGSFMAAVAAGPVFRLLGARGLGTSADYRHEKMPGVNVGLLDGELAWRQHDGGHTADPNWKYFIPWAERMFERAAATGAGTNSSAASSEADL